MSRNKQDAARSCALSLADDHLRGFAYNQERLDAKVIAELYELGHVKEASDVLAVIGNWERVLPLVVTELKGERKKSDFSPKNLNIIRAYIAACAFDLSATHTVHKVMMEYARLFVKEKRPRAMTPCAWLADLEARNEIPDHKTFRKTLDRYGAAIREDRQGRPRK
jgi:hypothetical protein